MNKNCLIASINLRLLGTRKRKFTLKRFLNRKLYNIDEIYGIFSDDHTFQFVREGSLPFETWEPVQDKSPFTYYELVHKRQFQLFSMENNSFLTEPYVENIPWKVGETIDVNGHKSIPICARKFVPKNFIRNNKIDEEELTRFSTFITRILATDPSLLEGYFPSTSELQKVI